MIRNQLSHLSTSRNLGFLCSTKHVLKGTLTPPLRSITSITKFRLKWPRIKVSGLIMNLTQPHSHSSVYKPFSSGTYNNLSFVRVHEYVDVIVNSASLPVIDGAIRMPSYEMPEWVADMTSKDRIKVVKEVDLVIGMLIADRAYGHFFLDQLPFMMVLPQEVIEKGYFTYNTISFYRPGYYEIFGAKKDHIVFLHPEESIFARRFLQFTPGYNNKFIPALMTNLIEFLRKHVRGNYPPAFRNIIGVRDCTDRRRTGNSLELTEALQDASGLVWEIRSDKLTMHEYIEMFSTANMYFALHGSMDYNIMFMPSMSFVMIYFLNNLYHNLLNTAIVSRIYLVYILDEAYEHQYTQPLNMSLIYVDLLVSQMKKYMSIS